MCFESYFIVLNLPLSSLRTWERVGPYTSFYRHMSRRVSRDTYSRTMETNLIILYTAPLHKADYGKTASSIFTNGAFGRSYWAMPLLADPFFTCSLAVVSGVVQLHGSKWPTIEKRNLVLAVFDRQEIDIFKIYVPLAENIHYRNYAAYFVLPIYYWSF